MKLTPSKAKEILEQYFAEKMKKIIFSSEKMEDGVLFLPLVDETIYRGSDENGLFEYSLKYCMKIYAENGL